MKKRGAAVFFIIMGFMMTTPCTADDANWTGTWNVKVRGGKTMTFILNQTGHMVEGTYSSDLNNGKISLLRKDNLSKGEITRQQGDNCKIWMKMSPSWNDFVAKLECPPVKKNKSGRLLYLKGKRK